MDQWEGLSAHRLPNDHPAQVLNDWHLETQGATQRKLFLDSPRDEHPARQSWEQIETVELVQVLEGGGVTDDLRQGALPSGDHPRKD